MRHDAEKAAEDKRGNTERLIPIDEATEPVAEGRMALGILAVRVDKDVNVEQPDDGPP
jgi:hypothetical protein